MTIVRRAGDGSGEAQSSVETGEDNTGEVASLDSPATVRLVTTLRLEAKVKPNATRPSGSGPDGFLRAT